MYSGYRDYDYEDHYIGGFEMVKRSHPLFDPEKVWDFANQKKLWYDKDLAPLKIKDLDKVYLFNILKWADKKEAEIFFTLAMARDIGKAPITVIPEIISLPLFISIEKRYLNLVKG